MVGKIGDSIAFEYKLDSPVNFRLKKGSTENEYIYDFFNITKKYYSRWNCPQTQKSDKYNFNVNKLQTSDGMTLLAAIAEGSYPVKNHELTVYDKNPKISKEIDGDLDVDQTFILSCTFEKWGRGIFTAEFYQSNETINTFPLNPKPTENGNISTYRVNVTAKYEMDRRDIHCRIKSDDDNKLELKSNTINFGVRHKVEDIKISPEPKEDLTIQVGDWINCSASGNPDPKFEWRKENENKPFSEEKSFKLDKNWAGSSHTIICTAKNNLGSMNRTIAFKADDQSIVNGKSGIESWKIAVATVGSILGVALIIGIIVIIVVFRKRNQQPKPPQRSDSNRTPNNANDDPPIQRKPDNRVPADIPRSVGPSVGPPDSTPLYSEVQRSKPAYGNIPPSAYQQPPNRPGSREPFQPNEFDDSLASSNGPQDYGHSPKYVLHTGPKPQAARPPRPTSGNYQPPRPSYNNYSPDTQV